jgi:hypothetical protein
VKRAGIPGARQRTIRALLVIPDPDQPGLSRSEQLGLRLRADATISGRCACGASCPPIRFRPGDIRVVPMEPEADCPATSPEVERLAYRLGAALQFRQVIVEFKVAA